MSLHFHTPKQRLLAPGVTQWATPVLNHSLPEYSWLGPQLIQWSLQQLPYQAPLPPQHLAYHHIYDQARPVFNEGAADKVRQWSHRVHRVRNKRPWQHWKTSEGRLTKDYAPTSSGYRKSDLSNQELRESTHSLRPATHGLSTFKVVFRHELPNRKTDSRSK